MSLQYRITERNALCKSCRKEIKSREETVFAIQHPWDKPVFICISCFKEMKRLYDEDLGDK